mgnify:CR=1 FL=1
MSSELLVKLAALRNKKAEVVVESSGPVGAYTGRLIDVVGVKVLINRELMEIGCCGRRKKVREVLNLDAIDRIDGNKIILK